jgi:hypothetical protein
MGAAAPIPTAPPASVRLSCFSRDQDPSAPNTETLHHSGKYLSRIKIVYINKTLPLQRSHAIFCIAAAAKKPK